MSNMKKTIVENLDEKSKKVFDIIHADKDRTQGKAGVMEYKNDADKEEFYKKTFDIYENGELTYEHAKMVAEHNASVLKAQTADVGIRAIDGFKKDSKLDRVSDSFQGAGMTFSVTMDRSKEVPVNRPGEERKTATKYGVISNSVTVHGSANKGALKKLRTSLSEEAKKVLAG